MHRPPPGSQIRSGNTANPGNAVRLPICRARHGPGRVLMGIEDVTGGLMVFAGAIYVSRAAAAGASQTKRGTLCRGPGRGVVRALCGSELLGRRGALPSLSGPFARFLGGRIPFVLAAASVMSSYGRGVRADSRSDTRPGGAGVAAAAAASSRARSGSMGQIPPISPGWRSPDLPNSGRYLAANLFNTWYEIDAYCPSAWRSPSQTGDRGQ